MASSARPGMLLVTLFLGFFFLVGFGLMAYALQQAKSSLDTAKWPTAKGKIVSVEMVEGSDGDSGTTYRVAAKYRYSVGGREFENTRIAIGYTGGTNNQSESELYNRLKQCNAVDVRHDPFDPADSVLSFGVHRSIRFMLLFSLVWLLFTAGFALMWWIGTGADHVLLKNLSTY